VSPADDHPELTMLFGVDGAAIDQDLVAGNEAVDDRPVHLAQPELAFEDVEADVVIVVVRLRGARGIMLGGGWLLTTGMLTSRIGLASPMRRWSRVRKLASAGAPCLALGAEFGHCARFDGPAQARVARPGAYPRDNRHRAVHRSRTST
jgi:hypothetical protein